MTNTQKRIQKSSKVLFYVFLFVMCSCILQGLDVLWRLVYLLLNPTDAWADLSSWIPYGDYANLCVFWGCRTLLWGCLAASYILLCLIFLDISREYTPFRQLHVRRLRQSSALMIGGYLIQIVQNTMYRAWFEGGQGIPLRGDPFLVPLALIGLSYILDYACQLQNEADTTL